MNNLATQEQMFQIETSVLKGLVSMFNATSKDSTRYHLNMIQLIKLDSGLIQVNVTDGHILVRAEIESVGLSEMMDATGRNFLDSHSIDFIKLHLKQGSKRQTTVVMPTFLSSESVIYPNTNQLFPSPFPKQCESFFGIDIDKVEQVNKAVSGFVNKKSIVKWSVKDKLSPFLLEFNSLGENVRSLKALIMPVRI